MSMYLKSKTLKVFFTSRGHRYPWVGFKGVRISLKCFIHMLPLWVTLLNCTLRLGYDEGGRVEQHSLAGRGILKNSITTLFLYYYNL